jgi:hypothetical protein
MKPPTVGLFLFEVGCFSLNYLRIKMSRLDKILIVVTVLSLAFAVFSFYKDLDTVKRWQERAWENWTTQLTNILNGVSTDNPDVPEDWWSQNPWTVAFYVWVKILYNLVAAISGISGVIYNIVKIIIGRV